MRGIPTNPIQLNPLGQKQTLQINPCPSCGRTNAKQIPGTGPHHAGLRCANCDRFIKWLAKPGRQA